MHADDGDAAHSGEHERETEFQRAVTAPVAVVVAPRPPTDRRQRRHRGTRRGRWLGVLAAGVPAIALLLFAALLLGEAAGVSYSAQALTVGLGRTAVPTATVAAPPTPTPTVLSTPPSRARAVHIGRNLMWNATQGCAKGVPPATGPVVYTALPHTNAQVPNEVALTFDDGPTPYSTPPILDFLERTNTPATFFVVGEYVQKWPELIRREYASGFALGVHTWNHAYMPRLSRAQQERQLGDTLNALHNVLGADACVWFWRPPYGAYDQAVLQEARAHNLTTIMWDDDGRDWTRPGTNVIANRILAQVRPGSIILLHDGPALREQTAAALPLILEGLKARGLKPVTLPQLLADAHYPGVEMGVTGG